MQHPSVLIEDWAIALCTAAVVTILFQKIKQPPVLGYLIAGMIVGPYTPPFSFIDDEQDIRMLAEFGVIFLMFALGLEFSLSKLVKVGFSVFVTAVFEVVGMMTIGYYAGSFLGWNFYDSLLLGAALAISSTTIIIKTLDHFRLKKEYFSQLMVGILIVEDLLAILLLVFFTNFVHSNVENPSIIWAGGKLLLVVSTWILLGYLIIPYVMGKIRHYINHETLTIISIGLCLFLSALSLHFQYSVALGAFIMGSILAETPQAQRIEALTLPIRDVFAAVFFVSVGMLIDPMMLYEHFWVILFLAAITIAGKLLATGMGALLSGQSLSDSIKVGFGMAQIGEFSFILIGLGGAGELISPTLYPIVVAISAITTFTTPYLIRFSLPFSAWVTSSLPASWAKSLDNYQAKVKAIISRPSESSEVTQTIFRFVAGAIVIAILGTFTPNYLFPYIPDEMTPIVWGLLLLVAAPFVWAMVAGLESPILRLGLTAVELAFLGYNAFSSWTMVVYTLIFSGFVLFCASHFLSQCYHWLEQLFIGNLSLEKDTPLFDIGYGEDTVNLYILKTITIDEGSPLINRTLASSDIVPKSQGMVVGLERAGSQILNPDPRTQLREGDQLLIFGKTT